MSQCGIIIFEKEVTTFMQVRNIYYLLTKLIVLTSTLYKKIRNEKFQLYWHEYLYLFYACHITFHTEIISMYYKKNSIM